MKDEIQKEKTNAERQRDDRDQNNGGKDRLDVWVSPHTKVRLQTLGLLNGKANMGETLDWVVEELSKQVDPEVWYRTLDELRLKIAREWGFTR